MQTRDCSAQLTDVTQQWKYKWDTKVFSEKLEEITWEKVREMAFLEDAFKELDSLMTRFYVLSGHYGSTKEFRAVIKNTGTVTIQFQDSGTYHFYWIQPESESAFVIEGNPLNGNDAVIRFVNAMYGSKDKDEFEATVLGEFVKKDEYLEFGEAYMNAMKYFSVCLMASNNARLKEMREQLVFRL